MRNRLFYILTAFLFAVTGCNSGTKEQASHSDCMDFPEQVSRNWEILTNSETIIPKPVGIVCDSNSIDVLGLFLRNGCTNMIFPPVPKPATSSLPDKVLKIVSTLSQ